MIRWVLSVKLPMIDLFRLLRFGASCVMDRTMDFYEANPATMQRADIVVGIPSYNEAQTIAYPTSQADQGLLQYFGDKAAVIIN